MAQAATKVAKTAPKGISVEAIQAKAHEQADLITKQVADSEASAGRLKEINAQYQAAFARGDIDQVKILNADFKSALESSKQDGRNLAQSLVGLGENFKDIGIAIAEVQTFSPEEQKVIDDAKAILSQMEGREGAANIDLANAEKKTEMFGFRARAVAAAKDAIAKAKAQVATAKEAVTSAQQLAEQMQRDRLEKMNLDQSLQNLQTVTSRITNIAKERIAEINAAIESVEEGRKAMNIDLEKYSVQITDGDALIAEKKAEIEGIIAQQGEKTLNSPEWTALEGQIVQKRNDLATIEADRNKAFTLSQDGLRFMEMYKVQEQSQRDLLQFQQIFIATLEEAVKNRTILYDSHLTIVRAAGDQQAMGMAQKLGVVVDEDLTKSAVEHSVAIRKGVTDMLDALPEQVRRQRQLTTALAKSSAEFESHMDKLYEQFRKNFGTEAGYDDRKSFTPEPAQAA